METAALPAEKILKNLLDSSPEGFVKVKVRPLPVSVDHWGLMARSSSRLPVDPTGNIDAPSLPTSTFSISKARGGKTLYTNSVVI